MDVTVVFICILILIIVYLRTKKVSRYQKLTANIPEIKSYPVIGSVLEVGSTNAEIFRDVNKLMGLCGDIGKGWLGPYFLIGVAAPEIIGEILANDKLIDKPFIYDYFFPQMDPTTLFISNGNQWRKRRRMDAQAFHFKMFDKYLEVFNSNSRKLIKNLKIKLGEPGFNICYYINFCALDIIFESTLGLDAEVQKKRSIQIVDALHDIESTFSYRGNRPWLYPDITFFLTPSGKKIRRSMKLLYEFIDEMMKRKESKRAVESRNTYNNSELVDGNKSREFSDILLDERAKGTLSHKELKDEALTMIIGGYSTNSSALSFAMYCLMKNQDVQDKAYNELNDIFNESDREVTMEHMQKMVYLEKVIKETLRLYSPIPYILRQIKEDVHLKSGYTLPKGAITTLFFYHMHRRASLYPNPEIFDPERFSKENSFGRNFFSFTPFSGGSRICIGHKFAMLEIKVILSYILRNYRLLPPVDNSPDIDLTHEMVLRSTTGVHLRIEKR